mmetsp:Transcript_15832/g.28139  ORF Transcript_15832/g.28139 Transcript_15832/m.28139 type:complete len:80 (+) Transcript_15832:29-268(+)
MNQKRTLLPKTGGRLMGAASCWTAFPGRAQLRVPELALVAAAWGGPASWEWEQAVQRVGGASQLEDAALCLIPGPPHKH